MNHNIWTTYINTHNFGTSNPHPPHSIVTWYGDTSHMAWWPCSKNSTRCHLDFQGRSNTVLAWKNYSGLVSVLYIFYTEQWTYTVVLSQSLCITGGEMCQGRRATRDWLTPRLLQATEFRGLSSSSSEKSPPRGEVWCGGGGVSAGKRVYQGRQCIRRFRQAVFLR